MENQKEKQDQDVENTPVQQSKASGLGKYITIAVIVVVILSFLVEAYTAMTQGRELNFEFINKLLDTLIKLMGSAPPAEPASP